ncbi:MAG: hypothetical protein DHS20C07_13950 [Methyloligella sp.]|nr:MAG: hypothetical protein DHS20C07_13950 [Methyloligella sp.]
MKLTKSKVIGREEYSQLLDEKFPEVASNYKSHDLGLLHCEVAVFRDVMEEAMESEKLWKVEQYIRFVDEVFSKADFELKNALEVSFIEDFAFGDCTTKKYKAVKDRFPVSIQSQLKLLHENWK